MQKRLFHRGRTTCIALMHHVSGEEGSLPQRRQAKREMADRVSCRRLDRQSRHNSVAGFHRINQPARNTGRTLSSIDRGLVSATGDGGWFKPIGQFQTAHDVARLGES